MKNYIDNKIYEYNLLDTDNLVKEVKEHIDHHQLQDPAQEVLRISLLEIQNWITVAKRMLINSKYTVGELPSHLQNEDCCLSYILGMEATFNKILKIKNQFKNKKDN